MCSLYNKSVLLLQSTQYKAAFKKKCIKNDFAALYFLVNKCWVCMVLLQWHILFCFHLLSSLQHADLAPTKLQLQMPTAPNVLPTARPRRNKPQSAFVRKVSTVLRPTLAQWPAHVSDSDTGRKARATTVIMLTIFYYREMAFVLRYYTVTFHLISLQWLH